MSEARVRGDPAVRYRDEELADSAATGADLLRAIASRWRCRLQAGRLGAHPAAETLRLVNSLEAAAAFLENPTTVPGRPTLPTEPAGALATDARFRLLVDSVRDYAIFMLDPEGRIESWNAGAERIEGWHAEEVIGRSFEIFFPPEDLAAGKPRRELELAAREGQYVEEGWRLRKSGDRFWAHVTVTALRDPDGRLQGYAKVTRDVTAMRSATEAVRQSEMRLRLMVEAVHDYAIFMLDPDGRVASWNPGAQRIKGYDAGEIIGRHFSIFYTEPDKARNHPANELKLAVQNGSYGEEGWRVRKDGTRFWANVLITAVRDEHGHLIGFAKVTRDMSERRRADDMLRQSEERLRLLVESVKDYAIFMLNVDGTIATWNSGAERINGYRTDEIIGQHFRIFYPPQDVALHRPERELEIARAEGRYEEEGLRVRKDGETFWANVVITAVHDPVTGELRGFAKVTRDLTERRKLEEEARLAAEQAGMERVRTLEAQKALQQRDEFISVAAHELRTPLTALQLKIESVLIGLRTNPAAGRFAERLGGAARQVDRLATLVERLLDVSRIVGGKLQMNFEHVDLGALAAQVIDDLREPAQQAGCELSLQNTGPAAGTWDRARIEQVAVNLISNAIKYGEGRPVEVSVAGLSSGGAQLAVRDHGIGIPAEDLGRIFARFERAAPARHYSGLGLGLYLTRNIVEAHGGSIRVESAVGQGSTFVVELPPAAPQERR